MEAVAGGDQQDSAAQQGRAQHRLAGQGPQQTSSVIETTLNSTHLRFLHSALRFHSGVSVSSYQISNNIVDHSVGTILISSIICYF